MYIVLCVLLLCTHTSLASGRQCWCLFVLYLLFSSHHCSPVSQVIELYRLLAVGISLWNQFAVPVLFSVFWFVLFIVQLCSDAVSGNAASAANQGIMFFLLTRFVVIVWIVQCTLFLCDCCVKVLMCLQCVWMLCHAVLPRGSDLRGVISGSRAAQPLQVVPGRLHSSSGWERHAQVRWFHFYTFTSSCSLIRFVCGGELFLLLLLFSVVCKNIWNEKHHRDHAYLLSCSIFVFTLKTLYTIVFLYLSLWFSLFPSLFLFLSLFTFHLSLSLSFPHSLSLSLSFFISVTFSLSLFISLSLSFSLFLSLLLSFSYFLLLSLIITFSPLFPFFSLSVTFSPLFPFFSLSVTFSPLFLFFSPSFFPSTATTESWKCCDSVFLY